MAEGLTLSRVGYGAMQLSGPNILGPPADRQEAIDVLRTAVELGVNHVDTADYYGPVITNQIIREALSPYASDLHIATKVGGRRGQDGSWFSAVAPDDLEAQVHENLDHLGLEVLDLVYFRVGTHEGAREESIATAYAGLADLQQQGLIRHLGLSGASPAQLTEAQSIAPVVAVQNLYNLVYRGDDALVERTAREHIAFIPYFPLGGFTPLQSGVLSSVAAGIGATPQQVALAWLLQRSPTTIVIPGTSSVAHLRENVAAGALVFPPGAIQELDGIGA